jgi:hypothetical protein
MGEGDQMSDLYETDVAAWSERQAGIEATVTNPEWTVADPFRLGVTRSFRAIPEFGNRVLRVAHRPENADIFVLTAFWDRGARR